MPDEWNAAHLLQVLGRHCAGASGMIKYAGFSEADGMLLLAAKCNLDDLMLIHCKCIHGSHQPYSGVHDVQPFVQPATCNCFRHQAARSCPGPYNIEEGAPDI